MGDITPTNPNGAGRPATPPETLDLWLRKLEPFLKSGQKLYRACLNAEIPYTTVKDYYDAGGVFSEKIDAFMAYPANLVNNLFFGRLVGIATKQNKMQELLNDLKADKIQKEDFEKLQAQYEITPEDWAFIKWYATNAHAARDEYGARAELTGKDGAPLVPSTSTKEVAMLLQEILNKPDDHTTKPVSTDPAKPGENGSDTPPVQ